MVTKSWQLIAIPLPAFPPACFAPIHLTHQHTHTFRVGQPVHVQTVYVSHVPNQHWSLSVCHSYAQMCIANLVEPGDKVVVGTAGIWGQRVAEMTRRFRGGCSYTLQAKRYFELLSGCRLGYRTRALGGGICDILLDVAACVRLLSPELVCTLSGGVKCNVRALVHAAYDRCPTCMQLLHSIHIPVTIADEQVMWWS